MMTLPAGVNRTLMVTLDKDLCLSLIKFDNDGNEYLALENNNDEEFIILGPARRSTIRALQFCLDRIAVHCVHD